MGLENSKFLWALLLLAIPLVIHLFQFRKVRQVYFSNVDILRSINIRRVPRSKLKRVLVLLTRLFYLLLFIIAFGKPTFFTKDSPSRSVANGIIIDNSLSLLDDCGSGNCLDITNEMINLYHKENNLGKIKLNQLRSFSSYYGKPASTNLHIAPTREQFSVSNELIDELQSVAIVSDFKPNTIDIIDRLLRDSVYLDLLALNHTFKSNVFVDSIYAKNGFLFSEGSSLTIRLANSGLENIDDILVRLFNGNQQIGSSVVSILRNDAISIDFPISNSIDPNYRIQIEDRRSVYDNEFYFSLPNRDRINIALVGRNGNEYLSKLFAESSFFDFKYYSIQEIDYELIKESDLVILNEFDVMPNWFQIEDIQGDVLIIPSERADLKSYENVLSKRFTVASDTGMQELNYRTLRNPFFNGIFENTEDRMSLPKVKNLYSINSSSDVLLASKNPYLVRFSELQGGQQVYVFTGSIEPLQNHSIFLPVMYRIAEQTQGFDEPFYYELNNDPIVLKTLDSRNEVYQLIGPEGKYIPEVYFNNAEMILTLPPDVITAGHYLLMAENDTLRTISLNIPREVSLVDYQSAEDLKRRYEGNPFVTVLDTNSLNSLEASISQRDEQEPFWKYALLLALMFLVAETAIHRWLK